MIVVCGEALMDVYATGATPTGLGLDARVGGSPLNVAVGLARLGRRAAFFGGLSSGFVGDRLLQALVEEGVDAGCTVRIDAPATLGLVGVGAAGVPSYAFYGTGAADRLLTAAALAAVPAAPAFHFGSYAMVVEPVASTLRALVERERGRSVIAYDPNVRLNVEPDLQRWRGMLQWMAARAQILKISAEDLDLLYPGADADTSAGAWLDAGVALVVMTRGGDGATGWTRSARVDVPPVAVDVVDTVGAGDTFQAALLAWLEERELLSARSLPGLTPAQVGGALGFAAAAAAITCTRRGADMPRRAELP